MRNFLLNFLTYLGSNQNMIYLDCNRIKCSFNEVLLENKYSGPLKNYYCLRAGVQWLIYRDETKLKELRSSNDPSDTKS